MNGVRGGALWWFNSGGSWWFKSINKEAMWLYAELFFGHLGPSKVSEYIMNLVGFIVPETISN